MIDDGGGATRAIIMILDGAIQELTQEGYDRKLDRINVDPGDQFVPMWLTIRGRRVFEVDFVHRDGKLILEGRWIAKPSWWARLRRWLRR